MAFVYEKADPKNNEVKRWMGRVRIGTEDVTISLRLKSASDTKPVAQRRVDTLQSELAAGAISRETAAWLTSRTTVKLNRIIAKQRIRDETTPVIEGMNLGDGTVVDCIEHDAGDQIRASRRGQQELDHILKILDGPGFRYLPWESVREALSGLGLRMRLEFADSTSQ